MPPEQETQSQRVLIDMRAAIVLAVVVVVVGALFAVNRSGDKWRGDADAASPAGAAGSVPLDAPEVTAAIQHQAARALVESQLVGAKTEIEMARADVASLRDTVSEFESQCTSVLTNDRGRRIAASDELAREAQTLIDSFLRDDIAKTRLLINSSSTQLNTLEQTIDNAMEAKSSIWSPESYQSKIAQVRSTVSDARGRYRDASRALESLAARAESQGLTGEETLATVIERIGGESALAHAQRLQAIRESGLAAVHEKTERAEKERLRLAAIAADPDAAKILSFTKGWELGYVSEAYRDKSKFVDWTKVHFARQRGWENRSWRAYPEMRGPVEQDFRNLDNEARSLFGLELHSLFRVFVGSAERRDSFYLDREELLANLEAARSRGDTERATKITNALAKPVALPEPTY